MKQSLTYHLRHSQMLAIKQKNLKNEIETLLTSWHIGRGHFAIKQKNLKNEIETEYNEAFDCRVYGDQTEESQEWDWNVHEPELIERGKARSNRRISRNLQPTQNRRLFLLAIKQKNLKNEIETLRRLCRPCPVFAPIKQKNLKNEIETLRESNTARMHRATIKQKNLKNEIETDNAVDYRFHWIYPIKQKNLKNEIETALAIRGSADGRVRSNRRISRMRLKREKTRWGGNPPTLPDQTEESQEWDWNIEGSKRWISRIPPIKQKNLKNEIETYNWARLLLIPTIKQKNLKNEIETAISMIWLQLLLSADQTEESQEWDWNVQVSLLCIGSLDGDQTEESQEWDWNSSAIALDFSNLSRDQTEESQEWDWNENTFV